MENKRAFVKAPSIWPTYLIKELVQNVELNIKLEESYYGLRRY